MCDKKGWENEEFRWGMGTGLLLAVVLTCFISGVIATIEYFNK